jgi:hypothetical protein
MLGMEMKNVKFATVVDPEQIATVRAIAKDEGRQLRALVDEAFTDLIEKRKQAKPRPHAMAAYKASVKQFDHLYKKLAE